MERRSSNLGKQCKQNYITSQPVIYRKFVWIEMPGAEGISIFFEVNFEITSF